MGLAMSLDTKGAPEAFIPRQDRFGVDHPASTAPWYEADRSRFAQRGMRRRASLIRAAFDGEFEPPFGFMLPPPPLWIHVLRIHDWHYRLPFWRGPQPFKSDPESDADVSDLVHAYLARGGADEHAYRSWSLANLGAYAVADEFRL